jgi:hypothetical protein
MKPFIANMGPDLGSPVQKRSMRSLLAVEITNLSNATAPSAPDLEAIGTVELPPGDVVADFGRHCRNWTAE